MYDVDVIRNKVLGDWPKPQPPNSNRDVLLCRNRSRNLLDLGPSSHDGICVVTEPQWCVPKRKKPIQVALEATTISQTLLLIRALGEIATKAREYLSSCADPTVHVLKESGSEASLLILVPVAHTTDVGEQKMNDFEDWWFEHKSSIPLDIVVDLDYRPAK